MDGTYTRLAPKVERASLLDSFLSLRITDILLFFCLCVAFGHQLTDGIDWFLRRLSLLLYFAWSLIAQREHEDQVSWNSQKKYIIWLISFLGYAYLSYFWAENQAYLLSKRSYLNAAIWVILVCPLIVSQYRSEIQVKRLLRILLFAFVYSAIVLIIRTPRAVWGVERVGMQIGVDRNDIGMRLAFASYIAFSFYKWTSRFFYLPVAAFCAIVSLFSGSRKAVLILAITLLIVELANSKGLKLIWGIIAASILLYAFYNLMMTNSVIYNIIGTRVEKLFAYINGDLSADRSALTRQWYIDYAINMWLKRPLLGWGYVGFEAEMARINYTTIAYSHNNYVELLSTLGVVGFYLFYRLHVRIIQGLVKVKPFEQPLALFALVYLFVILILDFGCVTITTEDVYIFLAVLYCIYKLYVPVNGYL